MTTALVWLAVCSRELILVHELWQYAWHATINVSAQERQGIMGPLSTCTIFYDGAVITESVYINYTLKRKLQNIHAMFMPVHY